MNRSHSSDREDNSPKNQDNEDHTPKHSDNGDNSPRNQEDEEESPKSRKASTKQSDRPQASPNKNKHSHFENERDLYQIYQSDKQWKCRTHPNEEVVIICIDPHVQTSLFCIQCLKGELKGIPREEIFSFNEFPKFAAKKYELLAGITKIATVAPVEFSSILKEEDSAYRELKQHLEGQKTKVNQAFNAMLHEFTALCHVKEQKALLDLDKQLLTLELNYKYYKTKLNRYYGDRNKSSKEMHPDKATLEEKLKKADVFEEMEQVIKYIKSDLFEASMYKESSAKKQEIKDSIEKLSTELKRQNQLKPKTGLYDEMDLNTALIKLRGVFGLLLDDFTAIQDRITEFTLSPIAYLNSAIVKDVRDVQLLTKWVTPPGKYARLHLIYRGSVDGATAQAFHKKCDGYAPTLCLVRSNHGKVFGGFSDQTWNDVNAYKHSDNAFLFSLDLKEKYPVKRPEYAIYPNSGYGPVFGGGHDLCISLGQTGLAGLSGWLTQQSYSNLGHSFDCGDSEIKKSPSKQGFLGLSPKLKGSVKAASGGLVSSLNSQLNLLGSPHQAALAGGYTFGVEEIEVYYVEVEE